jgi:cobalt-zinc-cadmium efflux system protein
LQRPEVGEGQLVVDRLFDLDSGRSQHPVAELEARHEVPVCDLAALPEREPERLTLVGKDQQADEAFRLAEPPQHLLADNGGIGDRLIAGVRACETDVHANVLPGGSSPASSQVRPALGGGNFRPRPPINLSLVDHAHDHTHRLTADRRALTVALALVVAVMVGEIVAGLIGGSLALLADAGHMLTDAAALGFALFAAAMSARPAAGRWTFGYSRLEILAAQANGLTLGLLALWVVWSAIHRLIDPHDVRGGLVLVVALAGALASLAASFVLARASRESLNVRGAFLHVLTDVAAFGAAALAGALILATGWDRFDPIASLVVAGLMLWSSVLLLRESTVIFLEGAPADADPDAIGRALVAEGDVVEVHDLHVWTVTSGFPALSAHVLVTPGADCHAARRRLERILADRFGLTHTTLQVDHAEPATVELGAATARSTPLSQR